MNGPTLEEIRRWPATVSPAEAAKAFGISRSHAYELTRSGAFPAKVIKVGGKSRIITASILAVLGDGETYDAAAPVLRPVPDRRVGADARRPGRGGGRNAS